MAQEHEHSDNRAKFYKCECGRHHVASHLNPKQLKAKTVQCWDEFPKKYHTHRI